MRRCLHDTCGVACTSHALCILQLYRQRGPTQEPSLESCKANLPEACKADAISLQVLANPLQCHNVEACDSLQPLLTKAQAALPMHGSQLTTGEGVLEGVGVHCWVGGPYCTGE